jgi:hypothetical protein
MWFADALKNRTTFIVGSSKNAGKTTFLNVAACELRSRGPVALVSIGVDGEARDLVFGNAKPLVRVCCGDLIATTEGALKASAAKFRLLEVFPMRTVLGRIVLAEAVRSDFVELVGPETNSQLADVILAMEAVGAKTILIDGAVNRVTQLAASSGGDKCAGLVDVIRLTPATRRSAEERVRFLSLVSSLPQAPSVLPEGFISVDGALTTSRLAKLPRALKGIVVANFSSVFLDLRELSGLDCPLYVRQIFPIRGVVVNAWDVDETLFLDACSKYSLSSVMHLNPHKERAA